MSNITFNKTNRIGDDVTIDITDVAEQFWRSDLAKAWLDAEAGMRLERVAMRWALETHGGWDVKEWPATFDAIHKSMPRPNPT